MYDGDLTLVSGNKYLVEAVKENRKVITYEKKKSKEQFLNMNNFASMDTKSFNPKIGSITNLASNMISLLSTYKKDSPEYIELDKRIRLLRLFQGSAIDATKGDVFVPPPKHWSKKMKFIPITEGMNEEQINEAKELNKIIAFNNKIAVDKKAYFFGYVYPNLKKEYDIHVKSYRALCKQVYRSTITQLIHKENKSKKEMQLIYNYYKYMPLLRNNCIMNILSYYVEDTEFDNKWKKSTNQNFDYSVLLSKYFAPNDKKLLNNVKKTINDAFCKYNNRIRNLYDDIEIIYDKEYVDGAEQNIFKMTEIELESELYKLASNSQDIANYVIYCFYNYFKNKSKAWMWEICGDEIINNLKSRASVIHVAVEDKNGVEYLGKKYKLESVDILNDCD